MCSRTGRCPDPDRPCPSEFTCFPCWQLPISSTWSLFSGRLKALSWQQVACFLAQARSGLGVDRHPWGDLQAMGMGFLGKYLSGTILTASYQFLPNVTRRIEPACPHWHVLYWAVSLSVIHLLTPLKLTNCSQAFVCGADLGGAQIRTY